MKILVIIISVLIALFFVTQFLSAKSTSETETYKYEVLKDYGDFEIRKYEAALFSYVEMPASSYQQSSSSGFRMLAGYIFGGNDENEKIAMTSPVAMDMGETVTMMFMVPSNYEMDDLPTPKDSRVKFKKEKEKVVAAIRFSGWSNDKKIEEYSKTLSKLLKKNNIEHNEAFSYLGYNPPYEVVNRRNEIIVEVDWQMN